MRFRNLPRKHRLGREKLDERYFFSATYSAARRRFLDAATIAGASIHSYSVHTRLPGNLAIDVAILGDEDLPALVVSSGVHGIEGFFGSAVQLALLDQLDESIFDRKVRLVLIHSVNPFGFSTIRRCNEDNVDLNRNFLFDQDGYRGAPKGYARLNRFLNPESPPSRLEPFKLKALWNIRRIGLPAIKAAVAAGQYEFPRGLFFGGTEPSESTRIVQKNCDAWLGGSPTILHLDLHTGLGAFGSYKLLLTETVESEFYAWYVQTFGVTHVEPLAEQNSTAYQVSGMFGEWMQVHFRGRHYRFACAEFGTYDVIRVLAALRAENRAHHYASENSAIRRSAKQELMECFCPHDSEWRHQVIASGLRIIDQGMTALTK